MLRMMTREEMDKRSAATKIPNPYQVKEMGIYHIPSAAYRMLWMIDDDKLCGEQERCGEVYGEECGYGEQTLSGDG